MGLSGAGEAGDVGEALTAAELKRLNGALALAICLLGISVTLLAVGQVRSDEAAREARAEAAACRP